MVKLHLLIGIPGSGKSTFAKKLINENKYKLVSTDVVRANNPGIDEKDVWPEVYLMITNYLKNNQDVIFDATNITYKVRQRLIENIGVDYLKDYEIVAYYFPEYYEICMDRVDKRNKMQGELYLPVDVIQSYGEKVSPPVYDEKFVSSTVVSAVPGLLKDLVSDAYQGYGLYLKHNNEIIEEYSGFADIETFEPVRQNTAFRLASVSKQFIAYSIMTLIDKKMLSLDNTLYELFDNMPNYTKDIKISNLLNHTSGIFDYEDMSHTDEQIKDEDVLNYIRKTNMTYFKIGSRYQYSNTAFVILGLVISKISGKTIGQYLDEFIFKPLQMNDSLVNYEGISKISPRAYGNIRENKRLIKKDQYWCSATIGDGGIYSTVSDLKKWLSFLRSMNKFPYTLMKEPNYIGDCNTEYGFGIRIRDIDGSKVIYHCGSTIGTNTIIGYVVNSDTEFIFLTNENNIDCALLLRNLKGYL